jgi:hypothetical protein
MLDLSIVIVIAVIVVINLLDWWTRPKAPTSAEQRKRIEEMMVQWRINEKKEKEKWAVRLAHLNAADKLTEEEKEERENMRAKETHRSEYNAMNKGGLPYYNVTPVYSPEVRRKDQERCKGTNVPSALGLQIPSKNPNGVRWDNEAEIRARAYVGTVFEWMSCDLMGEPTQQLSYCMMRINGRKRWMYFTVTREKSEPLKVVINEYINTLDRELLFGIELVHMITEKPERADMMWHPVKQAWI